MPSSTRKLFDFNRVLSFQMKSVFPITLLFTLRCVVGQSTTEFSNNPDWMARIPDGRSLAELSIPGTHESLAITGGAVTNCQEDYGRSAETLTAQLNAGIRFFDIRLRITDGEKFTIHHGAVYQDANFDDVSSCFQSHRRFIITPSHSSRYSQSCNLFCVNTNQRQPSCASKRNVQAIPSPVKTPVETSRRSSSHTSMATPPCSGHPLSLTETQMCPSWARFVERLFSPYSTAN